MTLLNEQVNDSNSESSRIQGYFFCTLHSAAADVLDWRGLDG